LLFVSLILSPAGAGAQQVEFSSTLNPVGSGARATGMGGAFISVADDATAASWNPAGLIQLENPEVSLVYSYFNRRQEYSSSVHPEIESTHDMETDGVNYASAAYPFVLFNRNMIVSVNYQRLYEMDKSINDLKLNIAGGKNANIHFEQTGYLYAISPAMAVQIIPGLSVGATLNIWDKNLTENGWETRQRGEIQTVVERPAYDLLINEVISETRDTSFSGVNANFGILWSVSDKFAVGAVYKTSFDADLGQKTDSSYDRSQTRTDTGVTTLYPTAFDSHSEDLTMKMPASYGIGVSYRHSDALTVALDLYRTDWSRFVIVDSSGVERNPLDRLPVSEGRLTDTTQVRLGGEYLFIRDKYVVPFRLGLFYDPEPAKGSPDDYYGFSAGSGYSRERFAFDFSYQYRMGKGVSGDVPSVEGSEADIKQHTIMTSLIVYF